MFDFLFNPNGRVSRKGYLVGFLIPFILLTSVAPMFLSALPGAGIFFMVLGLLYFWPANFAVPFKRMHDIDQSGWVYFGVVILGGILLGAGVGMSFSGDPDTILSEIQDLEGLEGLQYLYNKVKSSPLTLGLSGIGALLVYGFYIIFLFVPGGRAPNRFGPDPTASGLGFAD